MKLSNPKFAACSFIILLLGGEWSSAAISLPGRHAAVHDRQRAGHHGHATVQNDAHVHHWRAVRSSSKWMGHHLHYRQHAPRKQLEAKDGNDTNEVRSLHGKLHDRPKAEEDHVELEEAGTSHLQKHRLEKESQHRAIEYKSGSVLFTTSTKTNCFSTKSVSKGWFSGNEDIISIDESCNADLKIGVAKVGAGDTADIAYACTKTACQVATAVPKTKYVSMQLTPKSGSEAMTKVEAKKTTITRKTKRYRNTRIKNTYSSTSAHMYDSLMDLAAEITQIKDDLKWATLAVGSDVSATSVDTFITAATASASPAKTSMQATWQARIDTRMDPIKKNFQAIQDALGMVKINLQSVFEGGLKAQQDAEAKEKEYLKLLSCEKQSNELIMAKATTVDNNFAKFYTDMRAKQMDNALNVASAALKVCAKGILVAVDLHAPGSAHFLNKVVDNIGVAREVLSSGGSGFDVQGAIDAAAGMSTAPGVGATAKAAVTHVAAGVTATVVGDALYKAQSQVDAKVEAGSAVSWYRYFFPGPEELKAGCPDPCEATGANQATCASAVVSGATETACKQDVKKTEGLMQNMIDSMRSRFCVENAKADDAESKKKATEAVEECRTAYLNWLVGKNGTLGVGSVAWDAGKALVFNAASFIPVIGPFMALVSSVWGLGEALYFAYKDLRANSDYYLKKDPLLRQSLRSRDCLFMMFKQFELDTAINDNIDDKQGDFLVEQISSNIKTVYDALEKAVKINDSLKREMYKSTGIGILRERDTPYTHEINVLRRLTNGKTCSSEASLWDAAGTVAKATTDAVIAGAKKGQILPSQVIVNAAVGGATSVGKVRSASAGSAEVAKRFNDIAKWAVNNPMKGSTPAEVNQWISEWCADRPWDIQYAFPAAGAFNEGDSPLGTEEFIKFFLIKPSRVDTDLTALKTLLTKANILQTSL